MEMEQEKPITPADEPAPGGGAGPGEGYPEERRRVPLVRQLLHDLWRGVRLALFLRSDPDRFFATPGVLALLALADLVFNFAASFLLVGRSGAPVYSAVPGFFFHIPLFLFFGYLAGRVVSRPSLTGAIPAALISLSIPIEICHSVLERLGQFRQLDWMNRYLEAPHYYRGYWWWVAAAVVFLLRMVPTPVWRRIAVVILFVLPAAPLWYYARADLWVSAGEEAESGPLHLTEKVLSAQARLLDDQLADLLPGVAGQSHFYFVGFAGDGTQDVFLKEALAAEELFDRRFGTEGRSIVLANNPQTADALPFATATNLSQALVRLGQVMNRDSDVLVLFFTSHGSRDHELAVENDPLELDQITPEMVRGMLKKSGIRYRAIIVSACFSGGFIDPLKNQDTLIMTAADAKSESFGCGYGEKYTWFGDALLGRALRKTYSFPKAFDQARETIAKWEAEQRETPSNPQIWVGKDIEKKLKVLEKRLEKEGKQKR